MNILFRLLLFITSTGSLVFVMRKIQKSQAQIDNSIFWILTMLALEIISIFPGIVVRVSDLLKVESPANLVFLCIIFLLLIKVFQLSLHISRQQYQIQQLAQSIALDNAGKRAGNMKHEKRGNIS